MASFLLKKEERNYEILEMDYEAKGYTFKPKAKMRENYIIVNNIKLVNPLMIDGILTAKFNKKYRQLVMIVFNILQSSDEETTEGDIMIALDEIAKLRVIILNKYQKFLTHEKEEKFIKQLRILENELRAKQINIRMNMMNNLYFYDEERSRGGR
ncbi:MAG: hypothetical protein IJN03_02225 [Bacilli bacterium]|nr:hypothetical protein [Bacilli bacterium]